MAVDVMGRQKIALSLSALLFMACPVFADSEPNCENPVAQQEMNICANRDFEKADAALNAVWKLARKSAEDEDEGLEGNLKGSAAALLAAQRGWLERNEVRLNRIWIPKSAGL
jgi:uncharacterized protein YecT (DUF1311 family)